MRENSGKFCPVAPITNEFCMVGILFGQTSVIDGTMAPSSQAKPKVARARKRETSVAARKLINPSSRVIPIIASVHQ